MYCIFFLAKSVELAATIVKEDPESSELEEKINIKVSVDKKKGRPYRCDEGMGVRLSSEKNCLKNDEQPHIPLLDVFLFLFFFN